MFLPYGRQSIDDDDLDAVASVLRGDFLTTGPEVPAFEAELADYLGAPYAIACANGTAALHLIALALELGPGDQVIVPTISFVATANAPRYCGAEVIFADTDPDSGHITPETLKEAISRADRARLKAVFVVHLAGRAVDLDGIGAITDELGIPLIEDACHATGSDWQSKDGRRRVGDGHRGLMAAFSFHPVKTLTTGEGGAITARDPVLARRLALLRNHGLERDPANWTDPAISCDSATGEPNPWSYELQMLGYNYRLTDIQAALGRSQLRKMPNFAAARRDLMHAYIEGFSAMQNGTVRLASCSTDPLAVLHLMVALFDFKAIGKSRAEVMAELHDHGIGSQVHYTPIHRQPYYRQMRPDLTLPGAEAYYERSLSLPMFAAMNRDDVMRVCDAVSRVIER